MEATRRKELSDAQWIARAITSGEISVEPVPLDRTVRQLEADFGIASGEASSLVLARRRKRILATDDGRTIKACKVLRVPFVTAIHFLIDGRERGILSQPIALAKLERFSQIGWYGAEILEDARRRLEGGK